MQVDSRRYIAERRSHQKKLRNYFWGVVVVLLAYFVFLGIFLLVVRLPALQAREITITGNNAIPDSDIKNLLEASIVHQNDLATGARSMWRSLLGFNNMLLWPEALPSATVAMIPQLANVSISKNYFFHTIAVTVAEREPFGAWCLAGGSCYWFDDRGIVFKKILDTQGSAILVVHDYAQGALALNKKVLPDALVSNFISVMSGLKQSRVNVRDIAIRDLSLEQVDVATASGPVLHFSLRFSAANDIPVLENLMAQPGFSKLQYVDFTVENRAYYK